MKNSISRSDFIKNVGLIGGASIDLSFRVYVGTYTENAGPAGEKSEGIYVYRMDLKDGGLTPLSVMKGVVNPSFLAIHPNQRFLYSVNEVGQTNDQPGGGVSAFSINPQAGELSFLNQQLSRGADPCYVSVDATGKVALVANYSSGSLSMFPLDPDGKLQPAVAFIQHNGSGPDPIRQAGPHVHSIVLSPDNRFALVADLGLDKVKVYQVNIREGKLVPQTHSEVQVEAGSGPRHLEFHPNGRFVYLINELNSSLIAFNYEPVNAMLREIQTASTLPNEFQGNNMTADVHVVPSGKFVYGSNRGHDSIVIYAIDEENGQLTYVGHELTQGEFPRNFVIDPTGTYMFVANQNSGTIVTFRIDSQTGKISPTGQVTKVPSPVCIKIIKEQ